MPSFDIVSKIDMHEMDNALDQANREISTRYDFKGSDARIEKSDTVLTLHAASEFQLDQMREILFAKLAKRGLDISCLDIGKIEVAAGSRVRQPIQMKQGIDQDTGKKLSRIIKDSKLKVQASIMGDQVRITGKKKDDLQEAIALVRTNDAGRPLQFINFRD